jgi:hypothetical protein
VTDYDHDTTGRILAENLPEPTYVPVEPVGRLAAPVRSPEAAFEPRYTHTGPTTDDPSRE